LDQDFNVIVQKVWNDPKLLYEGGKQRRLVFNLKELKAITKHWVKEHDFKEISHLVKMEEEIKVTLQNLLGGS
jgi:hypothetical protein